MIKKAVACLFRLGSLIMIFALPIGFYTGSEDSSHVAIGIHGGTGEFISSYDTGCQSPPIIRRHKFRDIQGSLYIKPTLNESLPIVLGFRTGRFITEPDKYKLTDTLPYENDLRITYYNPSFNFENVVAGFGLGYIFGSLPMDYSTSRKSVARVSGHFRVGNPTKTNFFFNFCENEPLTSGGGYLTTGLGYRAGLKTSATTSLSVIPYYGLGFAQTVHYYFSPHLNWDIAIRYGKSHHRSEESISTGIGLRF